MREPRVQYARTTDGVSIAIWTLGEGSTLVGWPTGPWGRSIEWRDPGWRQWHERLAQTRRVVRYDGRGTGLSDRIEEPWSVSGDILDLEAVVRHLGLINFDLISPSFGGPSAITYAAGHESDLAHLLLWCTWARTADAMASPQARSVVALIDEDWEVFTEMLARMIFGWSSGPEAHQLAVAVRESVSRDFIRSYFGVVLQLDATDHLGRIRTPTAVFHRRESMFPALEVAQGLASRIPGADLVLLEGPAAPWASDMEAAARAIEEFLGDSANSTIGAAESLDATPAQPQGMTAILFADIADSTALTERLGDTAFRAKARDLDAALRTVIREHSGTPIEGKLLGDGVLAVFTSARQAIEAALACARSGDHSGLPLHLGLHAGDVIREDNNVYGGAVNIASRISGLSEPGEVLVSDIVRGLARTSAGVTFGDRGEQALKGVGEPVRVWAVRVKE
jgi:class 3 adenylate cyclase